MTSKAPQAAAQHELRIIYRPLRELIPADRNARTHTPDQIKKIRRSLARFGWTNPILIADNVVIAGHARLAAALAMAEAGQAIPRNADPMMAPTIDLSPLSATDRRAYLLADNRLAEDAGWDRELLRIDMGELTMAGFDLSLTGFSGIEIGKMFAGLDKPSADRALDDTLQYQVVVTCRDEAHQADLLGRFRAEGLNAKPLIL
jgi:ParB-like chromosome segregation protein Spo0J